jgi:hypothetical protein
MEDDQGNPIREHNQISEELTNYYNNLLTKTKDDREETIKKITKHIPSLLTQKQNEALMRPITQEEVGQAVKEMLEYWLLSLMSTLVMGFGPQD